VFNQYLDRHLQRQLERLSRQPAYRIDDRSRDALVDSQIDLLKSEASQ
jgi:hypothetical protein